MSSARCRAAGVSHSIDSVLVDLPRARRVAFKAGIIRPIGRLFVWLWGFLRFYFGNTLDVFAASLQRPAPRRTTTSCVRRCRRDFAKLGQQLSMRADMLPYAYCAELGKMLDQAPAFPTAASRRNHRAQSGRPLSDVFEVFDPEPIGSASLACVYQAQLKTGEKVAVKVRRPGIGPLIAADLRALDWILILAETLTIIPPGVTRRFRQDFRDDTLQRAELPRRSALHGHIPTARGQAQEGRHSAAASISSIAAKK